MDNIRFGSFVAQLRKERGLTQKELAQRLHVTDKAVSKWETGRGFPDLKLLEPLAQTLEVSLVELLQGERTSSPTLSVEEAGQVAARAMDSTSRPPSCAISGCSGGSAPPRRSSASSFCCRTWFTASPSSTVIG